MIRTLFLLVCIIFGLIVFTDSAKKYLKLNSWLIFIILLPSMAFISLAQAQSVLTATVEYVTDKTIILEWTQDISPDFAGWRFYHTFGDPNDADYELLKEILYDPNFQEYDANVSLNQTGYKRIFVKALAFDESGLESEWSNVDSCMIYFSPEKPFIVRMRINEN